jgi:hypothetical protein
VFCNTLSGFLENEADIVNSIWFSGEAHFYSDSYVNRILITRPYKIQRLLMTISYILNKFLWCVVSCIDIFEAVFIEDTVSSQA